MSKANEPAYPESDHSGHVSGPTMREKLAMEIYANKVAQADMAPVSLEQWADYSFRSADIFFEQLEKNK